MITEKEREEIFSKKFTIKPCGAKNHPLMIVVPESVEGDIVNLVDEGTERQVYRATVEALQNGGDEHVDFLETSPLTFKKS